MPRVKLFNENEVLQKAMNLFWKQGYSATSIQDLVTYLGINRASLYDTFGDKQKLFKSSFELYRKQNFDGLKNFFDSRPNVKEGLKNLFEIAIDESLQDMERKGCFVVNVTTERIPNDASILKIITENRNIFENLFYEYLELGKSKGQIKSNKDSRAIASLLFTFYNGLKVVSKTQPNRKDLTSSVHLVLSLLD